MSGVYLFVTFFLGEYWVLTRAAVATSNIRLYISMNKVHYIKSSIVFYGKKYPENHILKEIQL